MARVYISVDMEGVAGISHAKPTMRGDPGYPDAVRLIALAEELADWLPWAERRCAFGRNRG